MEKCNICVIILSSTCCVRRQQKQLGFLWSGMIVKQLITLSLPLPAFSSANCWTIKLSIQFTKAVLWKLFCGSCVVCTARDGNTSQLYGFMLESFFFLNVNINIFSSEIVFFLPLNSISLLQSLSLSLMLNLWDTFAKKGIPHSRLWEVDFKCLLSADYAVVVAFKLSFLSCLA